MPSKSGVLVSLAVSLCMNAGSATCQQKKTEETTPGEASCLKETTITVANRDLIITLHDAERIKLTVDKYLANARPKLKPSVADRAPQLRASVRWLTEAGQSLVMVVA